MCGQAPQISMVSKLLKTASAPWTSNIKESLEDSCRSPKPQAVLCFSLFFLMDCLLLTAGVGWSSGSTPRVASREPLLGRGDLPPACVSQP